MNIKENSKLSKKERHDCIKRIIADNAVETQGQLTDLLIKDGFDVTQATVSRDIKELRLVKIMDGLDRYCYALPDRETDSDVLNRYSAVLRHGAVSVQKAGNIVVVKTIPGSAQGCAMALETLNISGIVGVIAGDDTLFIAVKNDESADLLVSKINKLIK